MNKEFIFNESMAHPPLCIYPEPAKVLVVGESLKKLEEEINKHSISAEYAVALDKVSKGGYDVIYLDRKDDREKADFDALYTLLTDDGIAVINTKNWDEEGYGNELSKCDRFRFVIPYKENLLYLSKKQHPTADVRLQNVDMLDGCEYYNAEIHNALFAMPTYIYKNLKKDLKL